ncbi:MAG: hypothetical protein HZA69_02525 [Gammaproteobacteria bacterium]|nr:hypothetical protein [Gammaproteobacteria bacterium]
MNTTIHLHGKPVRVELSAAAERALVRRSEPLYAEVQLIFGCMIAKRVWFRDEAVENAVPVNSKLSVWFRPARYEKACSFDDIDSGAEASDYPLAVDRRRFVPDLLFIDYRNGKFAGDFTYSMDVFREQNMALESPK